MISLSINKYLLSMNHTLGPEDTVVSLPTQNLYSRRVIIIVSPSVKAPFDTVRFFEATSSALSSMSQNPLCHHETLPGHQLLLSPTSTVLRVHNNEATLFFPQSWMCRISEALLRPRHPFAISALSPTQGRPCFLHRACWLPEYELRNRHNIPASALGFHDPVSWSQLQGKAGV